MTVSPSILKVCSMFHLTESMFISTAPYSFTTQPSLELHVHSGRALITSLLSSLATLPFLRPAEPGEFTRQAFLGGRIDLTQVEGLQDLIDADTEVQRAWALKSTAVSSRLPQPPLKIDRCRERPKSNTTALEMASSTA